MKQFTIIAFMLTCLLYASCKLDNVNPNQSKQITTTLKQSPKDPQTQLSVTGIWKWSAQYDYGAYEGDLLNPDNTGVQETLTLNADSTWSQTKNGNVVNTGTYKIANVITPGGPAIFLKIINDLNPNAQTYDNFDFGTGFNGSYACSTDSLIFYGVYSTPTTTNVVTERVYVK